MKKIFFSYTQWHPRHPHLFLLVHIYHLFLNPRHGQFENCIFLKNMHIYVTEKVIDVVQNHSIQMLMILLTKKVFVLNEYILFSTYKNWLFEPNDAIFYDFSLILHFFQDSPEKV